MTTTSATEIMPERPERRLFQRVAVMIYGRFMLEDRTEHPCEVLNMSPGNLALRSSFIGKPGEKCIVYLDHIGRVAGVVSRATPDGFAITINTSERKKDKLAARLTWLANKHELDLPEDRRHERFPPRDPRSTLKLADGREAPCRIIDLSLSGAAIETPFRPDIGSQLILGTLRGQVVRHFDEGIAIEFAAVQRQDTLKEHFPGA